MAATSTQIATMTSHANPLYDFAQCALKIVDAKLTHTKEVNLEVFLDAYNLFQFLLYKTNLDLALVNALIHYPNHLKRMFIYIKLCRCVSVSFLRKMCDYCEAKFLLKRMYRLYIKLWMHNTTNRDKNGL